MEPKKTNRFSFTEAAAQQPSRQRFSFAQPAQPKLNDVLNQRFPARVAAATTPGGYDRAKPSFIEGFKQKFTSPPSKEDIKKKQERNRLFVKNIPKNYPQFARDVTLGASNFMQEVAQGTARGYLAIGGAINQINPFLKDQKPFTPRTDFTAALLGAEKDKPITLRSVGEEIPGLEGSAAAPAVGFALSAADLIPGAGGAFKKTVQELSKLSDAKKIASLLEETFPTLKGTRDLDALSRSIAVETDMAAIERQLNFAISRNAPKLRTGFDINNPPPAREGEEVWYFTRTSSENGRPDEIQWLARTPQEALKYGDEATVEAISLPKGVVSIPGDETKRLAGYGTVPRSVIDERSVRFNPEDGTTSGRFSFTQDQQNIARSISESKRGRQMDIQRRKDTADFVSDEVLPSGAPRTAGPRAPKIENRFKQNFPELGSANRMDEIRQKTRGVRSNEQSLEAARKLGYSEEKVLRIPDGKALNAEEKMAVSGVTENARLVLKSMEDRLSQMDPRSKSANDLRDDIAQQKIRVFQLMAVERGVAAEAGRALQAHKAAVTAIEQQERAIAKVLADPKTPQDLKDYIYKTIGEFDGTPDEMSKLLRELNQASLTEMAVEFATAAKLWATQTHIVNVISSLSRMLLNSPIYGVAAVFDSVLSKLKGRPRERFMSDAVAELQGQMMGWRHAGHEAAKALMDESYAFEARKLKDVQPKGPAIKGRPGKNELSDKIMNVFGKAVRTPFRILGVEDVLIRKPSEMGALYTAINRKARMEGLKPGTKAWNDFVAKATTDPVGEFGVDFMQEVQTIADGNLFQESLHPVLKRMSDWREDFPPLKLIVPFFRTIVNLQKQAIQFSLLSPILPSSRKALKEGDGVAAEVLAKMTLGTAVTIPLVYHAMEDKITLAAPTNPAQRDKFYADGKQPYSIQIGDKWYPYHRFSPYSEWFVTAGAIAEAVKNNDDKTRDELIAHIFFTMTQNFFDKSFATGMHDFLEAMADPERADNWVQNFATGATVPNIIPLVARTVDPVIRDTNSLREAYISKIPYLSKMLPPKTDVFGKPISRPGTAIERFVSPVIPSEVQVDMVRKELDDIGYQIGFPGKTAGGFEMDDETYRIFQAASGKVSYALLSQLMMTPGYQNLSPRQKEKAVDKVVRESRDLVKTQVAQEQLLMQEIKNQLKEQGYSSEQAEELAVKTYEIIKRKQAESQTGTPPQ